LRENDELKETTDSRDTRGVPPSAHGLGSTHAPGRGAGPLEFFAKRGRRAQLQHVLKLLSLKDE
jgi:hypothetical protein